MNSGNVEENLSRAAEIEFESTAAQKDKNSKNNSSESDAEGELEGYTLPEPKDHSITDPLFKDTIVFTALNKETGFLDVSE